MVKKINVQIFYAFNSQAWVSLCNPDGTGLGPFKCSSEHPTTHLSGRRIFLQHLLTWLQVGLSRDALAVFMLAQCIGDLADSLFGIQSQIVSKSKNHPAKIIQQIKPVQPNFKQ
ncbi:hypothetical protein ATANTOWER_007523 [Ataeniobius toweri]|uniref:Uncharacterized protein n=1 Tax=Ataeniobius toweri TaxID=208326 RepID=A0ABU7AXK8_9TELE|nr:hypothetical protein [Ataeniobius toweri]